MEWFVLGDHLVPTPLSWEGTSFRLHKARTFLGNLFQYFTAFYIQDFFLISNLMIDPKNFKTLERTYKII